MRVRADQVQAGDRLDTCEVVWVLRTPDQRSVVLGLRSLLPRRGGLTRATARYGAGATVTVVRRPLPAAQAAGSVKGAGTV
jgi:hypothetical protein